MQQFTVLFARKINNPSLIEIDSRLFHPKVNWIEGGKCKQWNEKSTLDADGNFLFTSWWIQSFCFTFASCCSSFWIFDVFTSFHIFISSALSNRPTPPPHRKTSLPKHSDVKQKFLEMCHTTFSDDVKVALRLPSFDSYEYEDYEILHLMEMMFVELNFVEKFHITPTRLREWLYEVYKHYNDVPFHNFRHCFCVSQMVRQSTSAFCLLRNSSHNPLNGEKAQK